jgi:uncharacterized iron-regulated membrane protein
MRSTRPWWVWLHRWVGLVAGLLMALLGLSGALMVWQAELDRALNPAWLGPQALCPGPAPARPVAATLAVLRRSAPQARPAIVLAPEQPGAAWRVWEARDPRTGWRREHFIDPVCGRALGWRDRGAPRPTVPTWCPRSMNCTATCWPARRDTGWWAAAACCCWA